MKKILCIFSFLFLLMPMTTFAKEYDFNKISYMPTTGNYQFAILHPGDVISFSNTATDHKYELYIGTDTRLDNNCYAANINGCLNSYTVTKNMYLLDISNYRYADNIFTMKPLFEEYTGKNNIYNITEMVEGHVYKSGDIITFNNGLMESYYYNEDDTLLYVGNYRNVEKVPQYNNKDITWKVTFYSDGGYGLDCPHFKPFVYEEPKFYLECNDKVIEYGKKTDCTVYVTSKYLLRKVSFDLSNPNFKISDEKPSNAMTVIQGDGEYNYQFPNQYDNSQKYPILYFRLAGTKPENYTDNIKLVGINYEDEIATARHEDVDGVLSILYDSVVNPNTFNNALFILVPIILLSGSLIIYNRKNKKKES